MSKLLSVGVAALFVTASAIAHAQAPSAGAGRAVDVGTLTDGRVNVIKAALQLTPDQEKYWPAIEGAIRTRAKNRQARIASVAARLSELHERSPIEALRDRDPVEFLHRRADALAQRSADLKRLADAWQPLFQTLSPDQRRRMAFLTVFVLREMRDAMEQRRLHSEEEEDEDEG
jgi:hypothetical protein